MPLTQLSRRRWHGYFDRVSAALAGRAAQVEVTGLGLDEEPPGEWMGLSSLSYDAERDELAVMLEGARRVVRHPREIHVHQDDECLHSIELVDAGGRRDILVLRKPLQVLGVGDEKS